VKGNRTSLSRAWHAPRNDERQEDALMNDPKKQPQEEPRRTSQPNPGEQPMTPMEAPSTPNTEFEKQVPHQGNMPIAKTGKVGEGSYEGTRQYDEGLEEFSKKSSPEQSVQQAKKIDPDDPELKRAEQIGKSKQANMSSERRTSSASIH